MKRFCLVMALLALVCGGAASQKLPLGGMSDFQYTTWINPEYDEGIRNGRIIWVLDDTAFKYMRSTDEPFVTKPLSTYRLRRRWKGDEGEVCYEVVVEENTVCSNTLFRLSPDRNSFECVHVVGPIMDLDGGGDFPMAIDPEDETYRIYYRHE